MAKQVKTKKFECPAPACEFNANMRTLDEEKGRPIILESTRSHNGEDAWRDYDNYNDDEELTRLRRAVDEVRHTMLPSGFQRHQKWVIHPKWAAAAVPLLSFIAEAFSHIDESLTRLGDLPKAWRGSNTVTEVKGRVSLLKEEERLEKMYAREKMWPDREHLDTTIPHNGKSPTVPLHSVTRVDGRWRYGRGREDTRYEATFLIAEGEKLVVDIPMEAYERLKAQLTNKPYLNAKDRQAEMHAMHPGLFRKYPKKKATQESNP